MKVLALSLLTALLAFGGDVAGKWKATMNGQNGPVEVTFNIQVADGKISGTAAGPNGEAPITEGKIDGDKVNFTVETGQFKAVLNGTLTGDSLKLTAVVGERSIELDATRVKS